METIKSLLPEKELVYRNGYSITGFVHVPHVTSACPSREKKNNLIIFIILNHCYYLLTINAYCKMTMAICSWPVWNIKNKITLEFANLNHKFEENPTELVKM